MNKRGGLHSADVSKPVPPPSKLTPDLPPSQQPAKGNKGKVEIDVVYTNSGHYVSKKMFDSRRPPGPPAAMQVPIEHPPIPSGADHKQHVPPPPYPSHPHSVHSASPHSSAHGHISPHQLSSQMSAPPYPPPDQYSGHHFSQQHFSPSPHQPKQLPAPRKADHSQSAVHEALQPNFRNNKPTTSTSTAPPAPNSTDLSAHQHFLNELNDIAASLKLYERQCHHLETVYWNKGLDLQSQLNYNYSIFSSNCQNIINHIMQELQIRDLSKDRSIQKKIDNLKRKIKQTQGFISSLMVTENLPIIPPAPPEPSQPPPPALIHHTIQPPQLQHPQAPLATSTHPFPNSLPLPIQPPLQADLAPQSLDKPKLKTRQPLKRTNEVYMPPPPDTPLFNPPVIAVGAPSTIDLSKSFASSIHGGYIINPFANKTTAKPPPPAHTTTYPSVPLSASAPYSAYQGRPPHHPIPPIPIDTEHDPDHDPDDSGFLSLLQSVNNQYLHADQDQQDNFDADESILDFRLNHFRTGPPPPLPDLSLVPHFEPKLLKQPLEQQTPPTPSPAPPLQSSTSQPPADTPPPPDSALGTQQPKNFLLFSKANKNGGGGAAGSLQPLGAHHNRTGSDSSSGSSSIPPLDLFSDDPETPRSEELPPNPEEVFAVEPASLESILECASLQLQLPQPAPVEDVKVTDEGNTAHPSVLTKDVLSSLHTLNPPIANTTPSTLVTPDCASSNHTSPAPLSQQQPPLSGQHSGQQSADPSNLGVPDSQVQHPPNTPQSLSPSSPPPPVSSTPTPTHAPAPIPKQSEYVNDPDYAPPLTHLQLKILDAAGMHAANAILKIAGKQIESYNQRKQQKKKEEDILTRAENPQGLSLYELCIQSEYSTLVQRKIAKMKENDRIEVFLRLEPYVPRLLIHPIGKYTLHSFLSMNIKIILFKLLLFFVHNLSVISRDRHSQIFYNYIFDARLFVRYFHDHILHDLIAQSIDVLLESNPSVDFVLAYSKSLSEPDNIATFANLMLKHAGNCTQLPRICSIFEDLYPRVSQAHVYKFGLVLQPSICDLLITHPFIPLISVYVEKSDGLAVLGVVEMLCQQILHHLVLQEYAVS